MSEPENKKSRRALKNVPPDRFQPKMLIFWLVLVGAVVGLLMWSPNLNTAPETLTIQDVVERAEEKNIYNEDPRKAAVIRPDPSGGRDWHMITGESRKDVTSAFKPFRAAGRVTDSSMERLQKSKLFSEQPTTTVLASIATQVIPFLIIIGLLYFLFVRQLKQAGRGAMSFGKSRAKLLTRDRDKITFAEVAGCDEAKDDVPFFSISGSDFVEMFVGVGASRVRDMFEQGRKSAPCLIFIDEIDAVGRQRGAGVGGGNDEREQTLNSLLVEMDGFDTNEGVIIIAATNRPDVLDSALLRPGRFDRQIYVDLPDLNGREQILRVHAKRISLADTVELAVIARGTPGLSGAELANLLNEAALLAARRGKKKVEMIDVEDAREKVQFGRERRRLMDDDEKKLTAYHEAGHALVQAVLDDGHMPVHKVTIIPRGRSLGSTMFIPKKDVLTQEKKKLEIRIATGCGGRIAEEVVLNDISNGASGDILMVTKIARHMVCDWGMSPLGMIAFGESNDTVFLGREITRSQPYSEETARKIDAEVSRIVEEQYRRSKEIILSRRPALDKIAEALLEHETIEGRHVLEILEHGEIRSPIVMPLPPKLDETPTEKKVMDKAASPGDIGGHPTPTPHPA